MIDKLIQASFRQRWIVLLLVLGTAILGAYNYQRLPIDAVTDITNVQVQRPARTKSAARTPSGASS